MLCKQDISWQTSIIPTRPYTNTEHWVHSSWISATGAGAWHLLQAPCTNESPNPNPSNWLLPLSSGVMHLRRIPSPFHHRGGWIYRGGVTVICVSPGNVCPKKISLVISVLQNRYHQCQKFPLAKTSVICVPSSKLIPAGSRFSVSGKGEGMLKVHAAVEVQPAACTCSIIASPSYWGN